jgi:predicted DNA-binding ribbon-helix-helix protein
MPTTEEALALRRKRNRDGQARYVARHFGKHGDLARVRVDVRLEARAALERLAEHRGLTITMLIEELAADSERALLGRLRPEQAERYLADDPELLAHHRARLAARESASVSKKKKPGARVRAGRGVESCRHLLQGGHGI